MNYISNDRNGNFGLQKPVEYWEIAGNQIHASEYSAGKLASLKALQNQLAQNTNNHYIA
ncbi:hypothetical protein [Arcticibacter tournemirensis]|uniref:hypothetical protein n=1 Tax=Arcticibacter tournemirensis TaxID=699437 RepID=UPI00138735B8|nr:hypothetical protein [Arcticibacter tournemirensis]